MKQAVPLDCDIKALIAIKEEESNSRFRHGKQQLRK